MRYISSELLSYRKKGRNISLRFRIEEGNNNCARYLMFVDLFDEPCYFFVNAYVLCAPEICMYYLYLTIIMSCFQVNRMFTLWEILGRVE